MLKFATKFCLAAIVAIISINQAKAQNWTLVNGTENSVTFITLDKSDKAKVIVGSDQNRTDFAGIGQISFPQIGYGYEVSTDSAKTFGEPSLAGWDIYDLYVSKNDPLKWFASIRTFGFGSIILSSDGGQNWQEDVKLCESTAQTVKISSVVVSGKETYYAAASNTSDGFRTSADEFTNCFIADTIQVQARDFRVSPISPNLMFLAGNNFEPNHGQFMRSTDYGISWQSIPLINPNYRTLCVMPSPTDPAVVFIGVDSTMATNNITGCGIFMSTDTGTSWKPVYNLNNARVFDIQYHPSHHEMMAAAADSSGVWISKNGGISWEQKRSGFPDDISVRKVAIPDWDLQSGGMVVLAGTLYSGFFKSEPLTVGVQDNLITDNSVSVYPNPASDIFKVNLNTANVGNLKISLYDLTGNKIDDIYAGRAENYPAPGYRLNALPSGTYMVVIDLNGSIQTKALSVSR